MLPTEVTVPMESTSYGEQDLGPLAWVLDELRKSLDGAVKTTRRFVREAQEAGASDLGALDSSPLRIAKQQLHQSCGALEMVGMPQPAVLLRAMEAALQHYVQQPMDCTEAVVQTLERASFALLEYLEAVLAGQRLPAVALFPQYRDVQALYGNEGKIHPADLWPIERRLRDPELPRTAEPLSYSPEQRKILDAAVLQIIKGQDIASASARMCEVSLGFANAQTEFALRIFWKVAAAYFDAMAHGLLKADVYTKRVASRLLMVAAALAKGDPVAPERLLQDMLFFCAQAAADIPAAKDAVIWHAVYSSFGMQRHQVANYEQSRFGRFDPALLAQTRKRIALATEIWSALAGGDVQKIKPAVDQFTLVCDSLTKLHPDSQGLSKALMQVVSSVAARAQPPSAEVAMEVATAVLYLQAAFASLNLADEAMTAHSATLAQRLNMVLEGAAAQPLEPWMEQLYRQVSDQQTMGSVVGELRGTLAEAEKLLDQYFRNPQDKSVLGPVVTHLSQMRGVLSVLGLDPASQAMVRMRQNVERLLSEDVPSAEQQVLFEKMGNSLGALGFLIDMLSYQRNMARKLYEFDEQEGELKLLMGRVRVRASDSGSEKNVQDVVQERVAQIVQPMVLQESVVATAVAEAVQPAVQQENLVVEQVALQEQPLLEPEPLLVEALRDAVPEPQVAATAVNETESSAILEMTQEDTDDELLSIFLEEAREVVANGRAALQVLAQDPGNLSEQTVLRRAFHTLKGSSRMVGLDEFGQAGWAMEQMLNAWLAEQKAMPTSMQTLAQQALQGFEAWVDVIEAKTAQQWLSAPFRASADAMRLDGHFIPLDMAAVQGQASADVPKPVAVLGDAQQAAAESLVLQDLLAVDHAPELEQCKSDNPVLVTQDAQIEALKADAAYAVMDLDAAVPCAPVSVDLAAEVAVDEISLEEFDALLKAADESAVLSQGTSEAVNPASEIQETSALQALDADASPLDVEMVPVQDAVAGATLSEQELQELTSGIKRVGDLSIPTPLFNVYLGEAQAWAYRLHDALTAWQENLSEAQPDMVVTWAHSLAGSSATVGFTALSGLARRLEYALQHVEPQRQGDEAQVQCFVNAAEEIRRLLGQFAEGVLEDVSPSTLESLQRILDTPASLSQAQVSEGAEEDVSTETVQVALPEVSAFQTSSDALDIALAKVMAVDVSEEDDIEAMDVIDADLFPIFEEEAAELLPVLGAAMREWGSHPTRLEARATLLRALHTLKGSARLAGAMRLGEMAHRLESALEALDVDTVTTEQIEPLFSRLDAIEAGFNWLCTVGAKVDEDSQPTSLSAELPSAASGAVGFEDDTEPVAETAPRLAPARLPMATMGKQVVSAAMRQSAQQTVRVRSQLLDRLINEAGEVMIARSRLDERVGSIKSSLRDLTHNLDRLRQQLRDVEVQAESQMQSRMQLSKEAGADFDPLEFDRFTRVQELTRMMAESVNDVATVQRNLLRDVAGAEDDLVAQGRQARELQRDLLRTRMVEFDSISERLYAVVRVTSKETGKQVKLGLTGGNIEMDRGVLERMVPAFEHLLRNCVDHGIEDPEQRAVIGKPATGVISVQVQQEGNDVAVTFQDDGAGLNVERIRDKALAQGLITADEVVDAARAAQLIFMPGFTTAQQLTGVSGRGIGMDVVRTEVQALGGRIETHSETGKGSSFRLVLPLTTAVTQVVMLRAGDFSVGVPASLVEMVRRISLPELEVAYRSGVLDDGIEHIPFYWAGAVWSQSARSLDMGTGKTRPVVIFRSASQRVAMHVDEVLGHQEVVVKNLGPQMSHLPGLTGMSVLASGAVALIYNPVALTSVYAEQIRQLGAGLPALLDASTDKQLAQEAAPQLSVPGMVPASQVPLVMVVDDSITVRRVSQRLLQREGYRVVTAADGLQALEKLQDEVPCVVLSDIEMPRMDGFDLLRNIRAQAQFQQLPIIMITSRIAQKHREHAMELGANHYLGKPYSDEELMGLVHHYAVGKPLPEAAAVAQAPAESSQV